VLNRSSCHKKVNTIALCSPVTTADHSAGIKGENWAGIVFNVLS
jgi:hypothetical protein